MKKNNAYLITALPYRLREYEDLKSMLDSYENSMQTSDLNLIESLAIKEDNVENIINALSALNMDYKTLSDTLKNQIEILQTRKKRFDNLIERIRNVLLYAMQKTAIQSVTTPLATIYTSMRDNSLEVTNEEEILKNHPEYAVHPAPKLDRVSLIDDLKHGVIIDGAKLVAKQIITIKG